jgi:hypothetical protein
VLRPFDYGLTCYGGQTGSGAGAQALFAPHEIIEVAGKVKTASSLAENGSCTVDPYFGDDASLADTTREITAYDWLLDTGQTVAAGVECVCHCSVHGRSAVPDAGCHC